MACFSYFVEALTRRAHRPATLVSAPHPPGSIPVSAQGKIMRPRMNGWRKSKAGTLALGVMRADSGMPALGSRPALAGGAVTLQVHGFVIPSGADRRRRLCARRRNRNVKAAPVRLR